MYDLNVANSKRIIFCSMTEFRRSFDSSTFTKEEKNRGSKKRKVQSSNGKNLRDSRGCNKLFRRTKYLNAPFSSSQPSQIFWWKKKKKMQTFPRTLIKAASFTEESLRLSLRQWISPLKIYEKQFLTFALEIYVIEVWSWGKYIGRSTSWVSLWIQSCKLFYNELISNKSWSNNLR